MLLLSQQRTPFAPAQMSLGISRRRIRSFSHGGSVANRQKSVTGRSSAPETDWTEPDASTVS